jgi:hypothetical protein
MTDFKDFFKNNKRDIESTIVDDEPTNNIIKFIAENYPDLNPVFNKMGGHPALLDVSAAHLEV